MLPSCEELLDNGLANATSASGDRDDNHDGNKCKDSRGIEGELTSSQILRLR